MRNTLWLFLYLAKQSKITIGSDFKNFLASGKGGWRDLLKWLVLEKILYQSYLTLKSLVRTYLKMRTFNVPNEVKINRSPVGISHSVNQHKPYHVDIDFNDTNIWKNFKEPKVGKYKIVSYHNGPSGVSILEILLIALCKRWKLANIEEVLSVAQSHDLKALGLGENYSLAASGTLIKRSSAPFSVCCPITTFYVVEKENTKDTRISLRLHDLSDNYPSGAYVLFRVN